MDRTVRRLTPEQQELAATPRHLATARKMAAKVARQWPGLYAELVSAAYGGLVDAASRFDPAAGASFSTYMSMRVRGEILDYLRRHTGGRRRGPRVRVVSLHKVVCNEQGCDRKLDTHEPPDPADPLGDTEAAEEVTSMTRRLRPMHRAAVRSFYLDAASSTMAAVGRRLGVSESRVSQVLNQAYAELREALTHERSSAL